MEDRRADWVVGLDFELGVFLVGVVVAMYGVQTTSTGTGTGTGNGKH